MTTTAGAFDDVKGQYSANDYLKRASKYLDATVDQFEEIEVQTETLSQILDEYNAPELDLLSLEIEGFELARHRPKFTLVED